MLLATHALHCLVSFLPPFPSRLLSQGLPLPEGRDSSSPAAGDGVWVLGLIRGSAAEQAGVNQGDQLLELDGRRLAGRSPFEVASLLQGQEEERQGLGLQGTPVQVKASAVPCVAVSWPAISPSSKA